MDQFPIILIPPEIREAQPQPLLPPSLTKPQPPVQPKQPKQPPPEPQPINIQKTLVTAGIGIGASLFTTLILSLITLKWSAVVGGVVFLVSIIVTAFQIFSDLKAFPRQKQAHEQLQRTYLKRLEHYS